jgi:hypothetical protein
MVFISIIFFLPSHRLPIHVMNETVISVAGQELHHQLPRDEPDYRQAQVHGQEVADSHRGKR